MTQRQIEILLVEDNESDLELTLHALRKENLANNIHVAHDGEEGLEFIFCNGAHSDRSFSDLVGSETAKDRRHGSATPAQS